MSEDVEDGLLLGRVASGDASAFRTLYQRYERRLFCYVCRLVRNDALSEELLQDVMLEVWRGAGGYRGEASAATWILAIARNKAMSKLRRRGEEALDEDQVARIPDPAPMAEEELAKHDLVRTIKGLLDHLSAEHREVIHLAYFQGLPISDIAALMRCPANTVKTRMFNARQRLKVLLASQGISSVRNGL